MSFNHTNSFTTSLLGISDSLDISITSSVTHTNSFTTSNWVYQTHKIYQLVMSFNHTDSFTTSLLAGPRSAVGKVSGYRCVSDCRSRGCEFDPGPVPYFRGDWSWNDFYGHSPPFRWFIQEGLLSVTSESMCTNYWLTACSSLPRKKCG